jgi:MoaA/NifB/PqqE/SkfB family radical SAM enzyme/GT2 family glycosyltransferase
VFKQDYPQGKLEIIVVVDGGHSATEEMLKWLMVEHQNLRYTVQNKKGPAAARNLGASMASGEILGYTDDDCILDAGWVKNMVSAHRENSAIMAIGGATRVKDAASGALVSQFLANGAIKTWVDSKEEVVFFPTCNISYKRQLLEREKFDELFPLPAGEDLEYFWRLFKKGYRYLYNQEALVIHDRHTSARSFLKQAFMYGRGNFLVQHIHKDHPLLKEIRVENGAAFFWGELINLFKIPRFSFLLGRRLIRSSKDLSIYKKFQIYAYFTLHKIVYLMGNIAEYKRIKVDEAGLRRAQEIQAEGVPPEFVILDVTHRCNLKCNICEIRKDAPIKEFSTEEIKDLITQSKGWGVKEFVFSGGEPLIREDIFEALDFIKNKGYRAGILTNGVILSADFLNKLLPYLASGSLSLSISLDSLNPQIHDDIRGSAGCFEKTVFSLKALSEHKLSNPFINFNVISIILNENLEELTRMAEFFKSLGVNSIQFQPLMANNLIMKERSEKVKYWVPAERFEALDNAVDSLIGFKRVNPRLVRNSENNLRLVKKYFRGELSPSDIKCQQAKKTMLIAYNGDVTTCFDCYGNVRDESLKSIFYSYRADQAREKALLCRKPCLLPCFTDNAP